MTPSQSSDKHPTPDALALARDFVRVVKEDKWFSRVVIFESDGHTTDHVTAAEWGEETVKDIAHALDAFAAHYRETAAAAELEAATLRGEVATLRRQVEVGQWRRSDTEAPPYDIFLEGWSTHSDAIHIWRYAWNCEVCEEECTCSAPPEDATFVWAKSEQWSMGAIDWEWDEWDYDVIPPTYWRPYNPPAVVVPSAPAVPAVPAVPVVSPYTPPAMFVTAPIPDGCIETYEEGRDG